MSTMDDSGFERGWLRNQQLSLDSFAVSQTSSTAKLRKQRNTVKENRVPSGSSKAKRATKLTDDFITVSKAGRKRKVDGDAERVVKRAKKVSNLVTATAEGQQEGRLPNLIAEMTKIASPKGKGKGRVALEDITTPRTPSRREQQELFHGLQVLSPCTSIRQRDTSLVDEDDLHHVVPSSSPVQTVRTEHATRLLTPLVSPTRKNVQRTGFCMPTPPSTAPPLPRAVDLSQTLLTMQDSDIAYPTSSSPEKLLKPSASPSSRVGVDVVMRPPIITARQDCHYPTPVTGRVLRVKAKSSEVSTGQTLFMDKLTPAAPDLPLEPTFIVPPLPLGHKTTESEVPSSQSQLIIPFVRTPSKKKPLKNITPPRGPDSDETSLNSDECVPSSQIGERELPTGRKLQRLSEKLHLACGSDKPVLSDNNIPSGSLPIDDLRSEVNQQEAPEADEAPLAHASSASQTPVPFATASGTNSPRCSSPSVKKGSQAGSSRVGSLWHQLTMAAADSRSDSTSSCQEVDSVDSSEDESGTFAMDITFRAGKTIERGSSVTIPDSEDEQEDGRAELPPTSSNCDSPPSLSQGSETKSQPNMTQSSVTEPDDEDYTVMLEKLTDKTIGEPVHVHSQDTIISTTQPDSQDILNNPGNIAFMAQSVESQMQSGSGSSDGSESSSMAFRPSEFLKWLEDENTYPDEFSQSLR